MKSFIDVDKSMSVADFKSHIAMIMRERETGKRYSVIGGPRAHECVVRKPVDKICKRAKVKRESERRE
jgi:hypothetical protein